MLIALIARTVENNAIKENPETNDQTTETTGPTDSRSVVSFRQPVTTSAVPTSLQNFGNRTDSRFPITKNFVHFLGKERDMKATETSEILKALINPTNQEEETHPQSPIVNPATRSTITDNSTQDNNSAQRDGNPYNMFHTRELNPSPRRQAAGLQS